MKRIELFGCPLDVATMDETVNVIAGRIEQRRFTQHGAVNVAKVVNMRKDSALDESIRSCDIINIDGMGIVLGARMLGHDIPERVTGIDLFHRLLHLSADRGFPVYLLGAKEAIVSEARRKIEALYPDLVIVGHHHGYFWDEEEAMVNNIRESGARLLFVAITPPKKEIFINKWKDKLGVDFVMGVGGSFDIVAGKIKRAPVWMQNNGLEWMYRIIQEPGRMWKRYLVTNTKFAWLLLKCKMGFKA
jgi:N-acetylglucosaminyldiphosphoundecaprenol N-acetyl-beta-D-mannosaminyltransferase